MRAMIPDAGAAPTLSVSIVLHESSQARLQTTLLSLHDAVIQARRAQAVGPVHVTVLDNGSSEAYRQSLQRLWGSLTSLTEGAWHLDLQLQASNPGFGAGHNYAQRANSDTFLLILNPDVELAEDSLQLALSYLADQPQVVALNPHSHREDGAREYLSKRYPSVWTLFLRGAAPKLLQRYCDAHLARYEYRDRPADGSLLVELLSGACLLCRGESFREVGGFDERFFMYFEDFDLSLRLATHGELVCLPQMRIVHHGGNAARKGRDHVRWFARSALRFFSTHGWQLK